MAANSAAQTLSFSEGSNSFESFLSYHPENMCTLGNTLISFYGGDLYTHDSTTYNNFYGVQYDSYIKFVFNDFPLQRKSFKSVEEIGSILWDCPEITTNLNSYGVTKQTSNLIAGDFELLESGWNASFLNDVNSIGGLINGDSLRGFYMTIKFRAASPTDLVNLSLCSIYFINSQLNSK